MCVHVRPPGSKRRRRHIRLSQGKIAINFITPPLYSPPHTQSQGAALECHLFIPPPICCHSPLLTSSQAPPFALSLPNFLSVPPISFFFLAPGIFGLPLFHLSILCPFSSYPTLPFAQSVGFFSRGVREVEKVTLEIKGSCPSVAQTLYQIGFPLSSSYTMHNSSLNPPPTIVFHFCCPLSSLLVLFRLFLHFFLPLPQDPACLVRCCFILSLRISFFFLHASSASRRIPFCRFSRLILQSQIINEAEERTCEARWLR